MKRPRIRLMSDMPTSPVTEPELSGVSQPAFSDAISAASENGFGAEPADTMRGEWRRLATFLKRPSLDVGGQSGSPLTVLARIYALDMTAMFILIMLASAAIAAGFSLPKTALAGAELTPIIILAAIVGAPVLEEIAFRSWLSGKPGHLAALLLVGGGAVGFRLTNANAPLIGVGLLIAASIAAFAALVIFRNRPPVRWFAALFPGFFWLSTFAFALVHLENFDQGSLGILLPLVLPQLILGGMLGYIRVRIGLWAAIALHAAHNATAIGITAIAMGME